MDISKLVVDSQKVTEWRRHFHMYPEIAFKEYETANYIAEELAAYPGIEVLRPTETSVVAVLKGALPGKVVGLRADIDALPIGEEADVPFKSKIPGTMHACGHDCHAAMLLGAVDALYKLKDGLHGTVKFIFQHAEEVEPGGASQIIPTGALDDVRVFYGAHVSSMDETGTITASPGPVYANADFFQIDIQGKGGHAARPESSVDPLLAAAEIVTALHHVVSRNVPSAERAVVTVGMFQAGTADNIIPDTAMLRGTVRTYKPEMRDLAERRIREIATGICAAYGATAQVIYRRGYSAVVNDEGLYELFRQTAAEALPEVKVVRKEPTMGGEDFSAYAAIAPAFFSGIGARPESGEHYGHHHPKFEINEDALTIGTVMYVAFAVKAGRM
jgi:amidohydrolase